MATYQLTARDRPDAPTFSMSARLRSQLVYFMTPADAPQVPPLQENEYWIDASEAQQWLAEGVFELVSPLDEENKTEIELSEEQEELFEWLVTYEIQHIRVEET